MLKFAYCEGNRIDIKFYEAEKHQGKILCAQGHPLIAKRGEKVQHHYSHKAGFGANCSCSEGKTSWHLWWQNRIKERFLEFRIQKEVLKIADAVNIQEGKLKVIEFQNSVMSKTEMAFRENFYTRTDLLSSLGVAFCQSELFWIFNLEYSSLNIDLVFGDFICARLTGGSKYMLHAKATSYLDFGKTQLVEVLAWDKTKTETPLLIGRVISLADLDKLLFTDTLIEENQLDVRSYRQALVDEKKENFFPTAFSWKKIDGAYGKKFLSVVENLKKFYFEKSLDYGNFLREVSIQLG